MPFNAPSLVPVCYSTSGLEVTFAIDDTSIAVVENGMIDIKNVGETFIVFSQAGNEYWNPAVVSIPLKVVKADQPIVFDSIAPMVFGDSSVILTASSGSGLDVRFECSDQNIAVISDSLLEIKGAGSAFITAIQDGNEQWNPATPITMPLVVEKAPQFIISQLPDTVKLNDRVVYANVGASSGLPVTVISDDEAIVTVVDDSLMIKASGSVTLSLKQPGNQNYLATDTSVILIVTEPFAITQFKDPTFILYPNPTDGKVVLSISGDVVFPAEVKVYNSTGKVLRTLRAYKTISNLDLQGYPQGLYFISVESRRTVKIQKLLISGKRQTIF